MDLFGYIKQKAIDAYNTASNFITKNPSPVNFVQNKISEFAQQPQNQNVTQRILDTEPIVNKVLQHVNQSFENATPAVPMYKNRVMKPLMNAGQEMKTVFNPKATPLDRILSGGKAALNLGGAAMSVNPINPYNLLFTAIDARKAGGAQAQQTPMDIPKILEATLAGARGERSAGLGDALTSNPTAQSALNLAELPVMIGMMHKMGGGKLSVDDILKNAKKDKLGNIIDPKAIQMLDRILANGKEVAKPLTDILRGTNKPTPRENIRYVRPQGTSAGKRNFVVDEAGNTTVRKIATEKIPTTVLPSEGGVRGQLPAPTSVGGLPAPGETTPANPVTNEILQAKKTVEDLVKSVPRAIQGVKSGGKKVLDYVIGDTSLKGQKGVIAGDSPAGKAIATTIDTATQKISQLAGDASARLRQAMNKLTPQELATMADVVEGNAKPMSANQMNAVNTWRMVAKEIHTLATETGMKIGEIEKYFPHFKMENGVPALDESQFIDRGANLAYGNLVKSRTANVDFIRDPNVLFDYVKHAYDTIVKQAMYGEGDKNLYDMARKSSNPTQVASMIDSILGKGKIGGMGEKISSAITNAEVVTKMGFMSPLTNLTQQLSAISRTDIPTAIRTYGNMIKNPEQALLNGIRAGEIDPKIGTKLASSLENLRGASAGRKWLEFIRFNAAENMNRVFSVNAGMEYATKLAQQAKAGSQAAIRELSRLGIKNPITITPKDIIEAGRKVSQETQFATGRGELPQGWSTGVGGVATQFKTFAYKHSGFVKDQAVRIKQEVQKGNLKPLATALTTFGVGAPIIGEINNDIRSLITNKKREDKGLERYVNNVLAASSLGLLDNVSGLFGQYGQGGVVGAAFGPFASDVSKIATGIADASKGITNYDTKKSVAENLDPAGTSRRLLFGSIPGVGKTISNTAVPNSYVENYVGPNVGLGEKDKKTYNNMKALDATMAEGFKDKKQEERKNEPSTLDKILGKQKSLTIPSATATAQEKKDYNAQVTDLLTNGAVPTKEQLSYTILKGKSAKSPLLEERMKAYSAIGSAMNNENYTEEQKQAIAEASGASPKDIEYFVRASKDPQVKLQEILPSVTGIADNQERFQTLAQMRRMVGGKQVLTSEMITYLNEQGIIDDDMKKALNSLYYDEVNDKFYFTKSFTGGSGAKKLTYAQAKAIFKPLDLSKILTSGVTQTNTQGGKLITDILTRKAKKFTPKFK